MHIGRRHPRLMLALALLLATGTAWACAVLYCHQEYCIIYDEYGLERSGYLCWYCTCDNPF